MKDSAPNHLREVREFMEHLAEITIRRAGRWGAAAKVSGTSRRVSGLPPSCALGDLVTRLSPGPSLLVIVAAAMLVGTAFLVHRCDAVAKQTGEMLESTQCS